MDPKETPRPDTDRHLGSPYGPQPHGTDEAAGGADSSPYEAVPSGERKAAGDDSRRKDGGPADQLNPTN